VPIRPPRHKSKRVAPRHQPIQAQRGTTAERGYGARWQKARAHYLSKYPLCVECEAQGRVEVATDLDHIVPHKGDMERFWDFKNNVQSLCKRHHSIKTSKEDGGFGNRGDKSLA